MALPNVQLSEAEVATLRRIGAGPDGAIVRQALHRMLNEVDARCRNCTGAELGWSQGQAQVLWYLIQRFSAEPFSGKPVAADRYSELEERGPFDVH